MQIINIESSDVNILNDEKPHASLQKINYNVVKIRLNKWCVGIPFNRYTPNKKYTLDKGYT